MLKEHFIVQTRPKANEGNIVYWEEYRVTVLGKRLFRLERSERRVFRDGATQAIWYRDMPQQAYSIAKSAEMAIVDTDRKSVV